MTRNGGIRNVLGLIAGHLALTVWTTSVMAAGVSAAVSEGEAKPEQRVVKLTVAQAVAMAVARNPSFERSKLNVVLAELAEHRARLDRLSASVDFQAGYLASVNWDPSLDTADQDMLSHSTNYGTTAVLSLPLYAGGAQNARVKRAGLDVAGSKAELAISRRELERAVYQAYWTVQGYELQQEATREGLEQSREAVSIIQAKVDSGLAAPIELNRFKVDVLNQEQRLAQLELAAYNARQTLAQLLHLEGVTLELVEKAEDVTLGPWPDDPEVLVARAVQQRPELEQIEASLRAARCDRRIARAGFFPVVSFDVSASGGNTALWTDRETLDSVSFSPTFDVTAGLNVSWNLFNNFNTRYQVAQAETVIEQWKAQAASEHDSIAAEVRAAYETWRNLQSREAGVRAQLEFATDNLTILESLYSQGNASLLDLLNAQSEYRNALTQEASFQVDVATAEYDLRWSAGMSIDGAALRR